MQKYTSGRFLGGSGGGGAAPPARAPPARAPENAFFARGGGAAPPARAPPARAPENALFARAAALTSAAGWPEVHGGAVLCADARFSPQRAQGVKGLEHCTSGGHFWRSMLEGALKQGRADEVAWLMEEGGEEAVGGATRRARAGLLDAPEGGGSAAAVGELQERAPPGLSAALPKTKHGKPDFGPLFLGPLSAWPRAGTANLVGRDDLTDSDIAHLAGTASVSLRDCRGITGARLTHLAGVHTLDISGCTEVNDAGLAHLKGIHTLDVSLCHRITNVGLAHLTGVRVLDVSRCLGLITDAGLAHLAGIHTLNVTECDRITDAGLAHLTGIHTLDFSREWDGPPSLITGAGLAHIRGVRVLYAEGCGFAIHAAASVLLYP